MASRWIRFNLAMNELQKTLFCFLIVVMSLFPGGPATVHRLQDGSRKKDSDWWSLTARPDAGHEVVIQKRELPAANFKILGLTLDDEIFDKAEEKLGKAGAVQRGDASTGRSQICCSSAGKQGKIYLIFEKGEVNDAFYLFTGGPDWDSSDGCTSTSLLTNDLSTSSGLHLGQNSAQVKAVLGKPSFASTNKLIYYAMVEKKTSAADFENLKKRNLGLAEDELHRNYEFYALGVYVEVRFVKDRLVYLAISKTESY